MSQEWEKMEDRRRVRKGKRGREKRRETEEREGSGLWLS